MRASAAPSGSSLAVGGAHCEGVLPPHLGVSGGGASEEVVGGLTPQGGAATLLAAGPLAPQERPGVIVHQHVTVEVAGCSGGVNEQLSLGVEPHPLVWSSSV